jgi:CheY-like chemotaxis protein
VKYTPPGGQIRLAVAREESEAVLRVQDTGRGIAPEMLRRVFDLFVQGHQPLDRPQRGLGLGLTLVKRLVELHGGTVAAFSEGPGHGSEFVVRLPALDAPAPAPAEAPAAPVPASRRILIVEDHQDARESLRILLEAWGHRVEVAAEGRGGLEKVLALRPDITLVDVGLPGLDGYALARAVRAAPGGDAIYLVALTGYGQPEDRRRAEAAGFNAHLVKPVDQEDLLRVLGRAVGGKGAEAQP